VLSLARLVSVPGTLESSYAGAYGEGETQIVIGRQSGRIELQST